MIGVKLGLILDAYDIERLAVFFNFLHDFLGT